jgi:hypothetical protein
MDGGVMTKEEIEALPSIAVSDLDRLVGGDPQLRHAFESALSDYGWQYWICTDAYHKVRA